MVLCLHQRNKTQIKGLVLKEKEALKMTYTTSTQKNIVMCCCRMQNSRACDVAGAFDGLLMRLVTERC